MKKLKSRIKIIKFVCFVLLFFVVGCGRTPPRLPRRTWMAKRGVIEKKTQMEKMQAIEELQLQEFEKDIKILEGRNPFSYAKAPEKKGPGLNLGGIVWSDEAPAAIINDMIVGVGDTIGNKKVREITKTSVILTDGKKEYKLELKFE